MDGVDVPPADRADRVGHSVGVGALTRVTRTGATLQVHLKAGPGCESREAGPIGRASMLPTSPGVVQPLRCTRPGALVLVVELGRREASGGRFATMLSSHDGAVRYGMPNLEGRQSFDGSIRQACAAWLGRAFLEGVDRAVSPALPTSRPVRPTQPERVFCASTARPAAA